VLDRSKREREKKKPTVKSKKKKCTNRPFDIDFSMIQYDEREKNQCIESKERWDEK